jgi:beta-lactamase class A
VTPSLLHRDLGAEAPELPDIRGLIPAAYAQQVRDVQAVWMGALDGSTWWEQDADEPVLAASLMKVPVAMAAEQIDLDRAVTVHPAFESVVAGERFALAEEDDQDPDTWSELGTSQTLRELRRRSIVCSGNLATNLVMEQTGPAAVAAVMPQVRRMIGDQPATDAGIVNAASARQWGQLLARVPAAVEDVMRGQTYRDAIPAGLPEGTPIANKTGWIDGHTHDMAIVRPTAGEPFALVVLTRLAGVPTHDGNARIAELARQAWERRP